jgi:phage-related baseplate assembly protein
VGLVGNGFIAGEIYQLLNPIAYVSRVENITLSTGGTEAEDDDHLRERIRLAPWRFNTAGHRKGYIYWSMTADPSIIDVNAYSEKAGEVEVIVLTKDLPVSEEILNKVKDLLYRDDVKPLTDLVNIHPVSIVNYDIEVELTLLDEYKPLANSILEEAKNKIDEFINETKSKIGMAINPDKLIYKLMGIDGVFKVHVISPVYMEINKNEVGVGALKDIRFV